MEILTNFLIFASIIVAIFSASQDTFWGAFPYIASSGIIFFIANFLLYFPRVFPTGIKGKINIFELKRMILNVAAFVLYFIFSCCVWYYFYTKPFGNHAGFFLGFISGSIAWASISLIRKLFLKTTKPALYQNIFALIMLIIMFRAVYLSLQSQIFRGDTFPDLPSYFNLLIWFWHPIMKNFKALFLYKRANIETKSKIIETSALILLIFTLLILLHFRQFFPSAIIVVISLALYLNLEKIKPFIVKFLAANHNRDRLVN